jgi:hypothetical protein
MMEYLAHHGIKGQKWGVRRFQNADGSYTDAGKSRYRSTSISAAIARRQNAKVDKSFKKWEEGAARRDRAIEYGRKKNQALIDYKTGSGTKQNYRIANKEYKRALRKNTTYRKGSVKQAVGKDLSRKYLSQAKKLEKELSKDPSNKKIRREYTKMMNAHDIERAKARRVQQVYANRSAKKAAIKRGFTMSIKAAAASVVIGIGVKYANDKGYVNVSSEQVERYAKLGKMLFKYI